MYKLVFIYCVILCPYEIALTHVNRQFLLKITEILQLHFHTLGVL